MEWLLYLAAIPLALSGLYALFLIFVTVVALFIQYPGKMISIAVVIGIIVLLATS